MLVLIQMAEPISRILSGTDGPWNLGYQLGLEMEGGTGKGRVREVKKEMGAGWKWTR